MNVYQINALPDVLGGNPYVGRGIVIGTTADGCHAAFAYFIMGRSENSRNRVFLEHTDVFGRRDVEIRPYDPSKVKDPTLVIYHPVRDLGRMVVVTNGDQTDTVRDALLSGGTFASALDTRCFEPDGPNWTPRISGILYLPKGGFRYQMNILKSVDEKGSDCVRETFSYPSVAGLGHFLHTYVTDGNPLPTFVGEPERVAIPSSLDAFTGMIWENLDDKNRISLYARFISLADGETETRLVNRYA